MVSFEPIRKGWLARIGPDHKTYGDPYTATAVVTDDGMIKGFAGKASPTIIRAALGAVRNRLNLEPYWERATMYEIKIEVSNEKGVLTTLTQRLENRADLMAYQRALTEAILQLGEGKK